MTLKTLLALLTISLLATCAVADDDSSSSSSEESAEVSPQRQLFVLATMEFGKIALYGIEQGKQVFEKTVKELAPAKDNNEVLRTKLQSFTDFIEKAGKVEPVKENEAVQLDTYLVFAGFLDIVNAYNTSHKAVVPSTETLLLWTTLQLQGINEVENGLITRFDKFFEEFNKKFEEYKKTWTKEQEKSHMEIVTKIKDIKDTVAVDEKFAKYFELFSATLKKKPEHHHHH